MDKIEQASKRIKLELERHQSDYEEYKMQLDDAEAKIKSRYETLESKKDTNAQKYGNTEASADDIIEINAGGKLITARRDKLCQIKGSRLEALFCGKWDKKLPRDRAGRIFLNVNPTSFQAIVDYLNELAISPPDNLPGGPNVEEEYADVLRHQIHLFGIANIVDKSPLPDSSIITEQFMFNTLQEWLEEENIDGEFQRLYKMSRDAIKVGGYIVMSDTFHTLCNHKGPTISLMKTTEGYIFGGYADASWYDECSPRETANARADKSFIFFMLQAHNRKMKLKDPADPDALYGYMGTGPSFGKDIYIMNAHPIGACLHFKSGQNYEASGDVVAEQLGHDGFDVEEIEVFQVLTGERHESSVNISEATSFSSVMNEALNDKLKSLQEGEKEISDLERNLAKEEDLVGFLAGTGVEDIIELNVSGTTMTTNRSTLQFCKESVLARQFDTTWTDNGCKNENLRVEEWTASDVYDWMKKIDGIAEDVIKAFKTNEITGLELLVLGKEGLGMLGVDHPGQVCILLDQIKKLHTASQSIVTLIEHSPYCFEKILDFIRIKELHDHKLAKMPWLPQVRKTERSRYYKIVDYYFPGEQKKFILGFRWFDTLGL